MGRGGIIVDAATPTRHTIGACFCIMGILRPLDGLPDYLSNDLERIQKRAMHIIYPSLSYHAALLTTELVPLSQRRQQLTDKLFQQILNDKMHKLHKLLPDVNNTSVNLRKKSKFIMPSIKTDRFKKSFVIFNSLKV